MQNFTNRMRQMRDAIGSGVTALRQCIRQLQREGRGHMEVKAIQAQRVIVTVRADGHRHKIFQILFGRDGSLYANFPYFSHSEGVLAEIKITGGPGSSSDVDLKSGGKVASHLVKYSHHPNGRAHFSQHGRINTEIGRQSVPLRDQHGHIFTLLFQGLRSFESLSNGKEKSASSSRTTITFDIPDRHPRAFRIVGRWYWIEDLDPRTDRPATIGPIVPLRDEGDIVRNAFVLANSDDPKHVLLLTCTPQESVSASCTFMMFYGGFDPAPKILKSKKPTRCLAFLYPADDFQALKQQIGTVDFDPSAVKVALPQTNSFWSKLRR